MFDKSSLVGDAVMECEVRRQSCSHREDDWLHDVETPTTEHEHTNGDGDNEGDGDDGVQTQQQVERRAQNHNKSNSNRNPWCTQRKNTKKN